jgi:endonuclease-3
LWALSASCGTLTATASLPADALLAINGVGPKMAFLYLQSIGMNEGIGVDVHVHRITHRLRWHNKEPKTPEETRLNLESWLPKEHHREINHMLVGFGQVICKPIGPRYVSRPDRSRRRVELTAALCRCDLCHVAQVPGLCPSRRRDLGPFPTAKSVKDELEEGKPKVEIEVERVEEVGAGQVKLELGLEERVPVADGEPGVKREAESLARRSARGTPRKRVKVEEEL